jgi:imidazolonepropionase-like amidohydrolase
MAALPEPATSASHQQGKIAITNVRVFDGQHITEPSTVVIDGGLIGEDAEGAKVIDGGGGVLLPGLIDAHVHLQTEHELRVMAEYGVTSALDMATWPYSKLKALRGRVGMTDIRSPGLPATSPGSLHSVLLPIPKEDLVAGPEDAARFIANRMSESVDYIKVVADVPGPDQDTLNALDAAAHEQKKLVIAHASAFIPFAMAQDAKVDVITHAPRDKALDNEACSRMVAENRISVPTLVMMEVVSKPPTWGAITRLLARPTLLLAIIRAKRQNPHGGGQKYENSRDSVTALYRAGVPILAGTDAHTESGSPFLVKHGDALHRELELLVEAGLSTVDALRAATSLPAKYFNLNDRGVIEVGKRADLVLISQDPIQDIRATRSIQRVWCGGIEVTMRSHL